MIFKIRNLILILASILAFTSCNKEKEENVIPEEPDANDALDSISKTAQNIIKTEEWSEFKSFWLELNIIDSSDQDDYNFEFDFDKSEILSEKSEKIISELRNISIEEPNQEIFNLIYLLCNDRINNIIFGGAMFETRMMPPLSSTEMEMAIDNLEKQIDILISLKNNKVLDELKFNTALNNVNLNIQNFSIINVIANKYSDSVVLTLNQFEAMNKEEKARGLIDLQISNFENHYANFEKRMSDDLNEKDKAYYAELEQKYITTKEEIDKLKSIFPIMTELLIDLER